MPSQSTSISPTPLPTRIAIKNFDGKYQGTAVVVATQNENVISLLSSTLSTSDNVLNGEITGTAGIWKIHGYVTDASGVATITASNSLLGEMSFGLAFLTDPQTKVVTGSGKGSNTFEYAGVGTIKVVFDFSITSGG